VAASGILRPRPWEDTDPFRMAAVGVLREIRRAIEKGLQRPPLPIKGLPPDD
jgi:hypothetical protein